MLTIFSPKLNWPEIPQDEIRNRSRILVIDDEDFPLIPLFERDGYRIDKWDDIQNLQELDQGKYDVIFLDIQGVGQDETSEQGLGVLRHLKQTNPTQLVIAYSNADWSLKYQEFIKLADAALAKSADYVEFKEHLDKLLKKRFSYEYFESKYLNLLVKSGIDLKKAKKKLRSAVASKSTGKLKTWLYERDVPPDILALCLRIAEVAIATYNIATTVL